MCENNNLLFINNAISMYLLVDIPNEGRESINTTNDPEITSENCLWSSREDDIKD